MVIPGSQILVYPILWVLMPSAEPTMETGGYESMPTPPTSAA
jgi:hypothetical protein